MGWGFLIPKGWPGLLAISATTWGLLGTLRFSDTINIGAILIAALVVIAGGVFTFRNNMRTFWRNLAEERAEQIKVLEDHLHERDAKISQLQEAAKAELARTADEQRQIRHDLKNQIAELNATLAVQQTKTDLSALAEQLSNQHSEAMGKIADGLDKQDRIIHLLVDAIPDVSTHGRTR